MLKLKADADTFFSGVEKSYLKRTKDDLCARAFWKEVISKFPPQNLQTFTKRPSLSLAKDSGDLAVALLWGAQATLIHPLLKTANGPDFLNNGIGNFVGALAVAEDKNIPFTVKERAGELLLNGKKKYITGGAQSDFILLTEKRPDDQKISGVTCIETNDIPKDFFQPLDMECLKTTRQTSLTFTEFPVSPENRLPLDSRTIRRTLKAWGLIEQSMIFESVTGLALYLARRPEADCGATRSAIEIVEETLQELSGKINLQIAAASQGERVEPIIPETIPVIEMMNRVKPQLTQPGLDEINYRLQDLQFFLGNAL